MSLKSGFTGGNCGGAARHFRTPGCGHPAFTILTSFGIVNKHRFPNNVLFKKLYSRIQRRGLLIFVRDHAGFVSKACMGVSTIGLRSNPELVSSHTRHCINAKRSHQGNLRRRPRFYHPRRQYLPRYMHLKDSILSIASVLTHRCRGIRATLTTYEMLVLEFIASIFICQIVGHC